MQNFDNSLPPDVLAKLREVAIKRLQTMDLATVLHYLGADHNNPNIMVNAEAWLAAVMAEVSLFGANMRQRMDILRAQREQSHPMRTLTTEPRLIGNTQIDYTFDGVLDDQRGVEHLNWSRMEDQVPVLGDLVCLPFDQGNQEGYVVLAVARRQWNYVADGCVVTIVLRKPI